MNNRNDTFQFFVRAAVKDPCTNMPTDNGPSFQRFATYLASKHTEHQNVPADVDDITVRIELEESRITTASELRSVVRLCDELYRTTSVVFHSDLSTVIEMKRWQANKLGSSSNRSIIEPINPTYSTPSYQYSLQTFPTVIEYSSVGSSTSGVWIGEIQDSYRGTMKRLQAYV